MKTERTSGEASLSADGRTGKPRFSIVLPCLVVGLMLIAHAGYAVIQHFGPYRVDIDVRTSQMTIIPQALIQGKVSGNEIRLRVSSPGFIAHDRQIRLKPGTFFYSLDVVLRDVEKRFDVYDFQHKLLASAFVEKDQTGVPPDLFGFSVFVPMKSWPHPNPAGVIVNQPGYGYPIQESCEITTRDEFYQVRLRIIRAVLDDPHDELLVYINTGEALNPASARQWVGLIKCLEAQRSPLAAELARAVVDSWPTDVCGLSLPRSLEVLIGQKQRFEELHNPK